MNSPFDWRSWRQSGRIYQARCALWRRASGELPHILGHRGTRHPEPENTLAAFDRALAEGARGVELDVRMTRDGELVIFHDPELPAEIARAAGLTPPAHISELTAAELARVRLARDRHVPSLIEALRWQRDTGAFLNVELKGDVPSRGQLARAVAALLRQHDTERVLISSFYPRLLLECALRLPELPTAWLVHAEQRLLRTAPGFGWTGAAAVHPEARELASKTVRALKRQGAIVNVWTVNEPESARRLSELGVDGLITDVPATVMAALGSPTGSGSLKRQSEQMDVRT